MLNNRYNWLHAGVVSDAKVDARQRLTSILDRLGQQVPCMWDPEHWYSDSRYSSADAEARCYDCPAIVACGEYADAEPAELWGVWGGRNRNHRAKDKL